MRSSLIDFPRILAGLASTGLTQEQLDALQNMGIPEQEALAILNKASELWEKIQRA